MQCVLKIAHELVFSTLEELASDDTTVLLRRLKDSYLTVAKGKS
jgi:hypothetical protein